MSKYSDRRNRISTGDALLLGRHHLLSSKNDLSSSEKEELARVNEVLSSSPNLDLLTEAYKNTFNSDLPFSTLGSNQLTPDFGMSVVGSDEARPRALEPAAFATDMMNVEKMSMMDSAPMEDREEVSLGGQTYRLPSDPVARDRYRKSLMQQQAQKDMMAGGFETSQNIQQTTDRGGNRIDSAGISTMFADMRSRPPYDAGFRRGLEQTENVGNMTLDDVRGSIENADRFRSSVKAQMPAQRYEENPQMIEELGYREALEAAEQNMMDEEKMFLQEGISFMPATAEIIEEPGL